MDTSPVIELIPRRRGPQAHPPSSRSSSSTDKRDTVTALQEARLLQQEDQHSTIRRLYNKKTSIPQQEDSNLQ